MHIVGLKKKEIGILISFFIITQRRVQSFLIQRHIQIKEVFRKGRKKLIIGRFALSVFSAPCSEQTREEAENLILSKAKRKTPYFDSINLEAERNCEKDFDS